MKNNKIKYGRYESGTIIPFVVMLFVALVPMFGLAGDFTYGAMLRSDIEKAVDASVKAGKQGYKTFNRDPGLAVNDAARVFKMNITNQVSVADLQGSTGMDTPTTLTYNMIFTQADALNQIFQGQPITYTTTIDLNAKTITVSGSITQKPFFELGNTPVITITKQKSLVGNPKSIVLVVDDSAENNNRTIMSYIGSARRDDGMTMTTFTDVIFYQSQAPSGAASFTANGFTIDMLMLTEVVINTPNVDIPTTAQYTTTRPMYINDAARGWCTNNALSNAGLFRNALTGFRVSELAALMTITPQDQQLATTYANNLGTDPQVTAYFNQAATHIEPFGSVTFGIMAFINAFGTSTTHRLALVTFAATSDNFDTTQNISVSELQAGGSNKQIARTLPFNTFTTTYNTILNRATIVSAGGTGGMGDRMRITAYPDGTTDVRDGLLTAQNILASETTEKVVVLYVADAPTSSFASIGSTVASLVASGIRVYTVLNTFALTATEITNYTNQIQSNGGQTVLTASDPAALDNAFTSIANELTTY